MSDTRPRLEAVNEEAVEAAASESRPVGSGGKERKLWIAGAVLAAGLLLCAGGWYAQAQESARLGASLAASEAALADTRADLSRAEGRLTAFEDHLTAARDRVGALAGQIAALGDFLADGPGAGGEGTGAEGSATQP